MSEVPGELKIRHETAVKDTMEATKQKPYPSFLSILQVKTISDLNDILDNLVKTTKKSAWNKVLQDGIPVVGKHMDAFALRRDSHRRYASRYALFRKGYDSKLLQTTTLLGKYIVNGKQQ